MIKLIIEYMDIISTALSQFIVNSVELSKRCGHYLFCMCIVISTPIWIIPYLIFRKKS
jgi:hypothetical protein